MTTFRIFTTLEGGQKLEGDLKGYAHPTAGETYRWHKWTADDLAAIVPDIGIQKGSEILWTTHTLSVTPVETSSVHQRWHLRKMIPEEGIIFEFWADIHHDDPVLDFWGKVVWSDRNDPSWKKEFEGIYLRAGEFLALDFRDLHGATLPNKVGNNWISLLASNITVKDGAGLPLSGTMPCFVGPRGLPGPDVDPEDSQNQDNRDFESLLSSIFGQVVGVCHEWDGHWLGCKNIPKVKNEQQLIQESNERWHAFKGLPNGRGWYALRPVGIATDPATTGDQEDFGATKGTYAVTAKDPRHILVYRYSVYSDLFRGYNHYESNGSPLREEDHPQWVTWSSGTHWHAGVSPDRLGKTDPLEPFEGWYWGYDDQHRSQNYVAATYCLTDDPLLLDQLTHHLTTDMAMYRMRYPNYGNGAARAQGRTAGAWANFYVLADGQNKVDLKALLTRRWEGMAEQEHFGAHNEVPVLASHGPDGRKPIFDDGGNLLPTWTIWEHGLAVVGFYSAYKADPSHPGSKELLTRLMETVVDNGCFEADDGWWLVGDMWYRGGERIPEPLSKDNNKILWGRGGVGGWTLAAIIAAADFLEPGPLKDKAMSCANYFSNGELATSTRAAEWWAHAKTMNFEVT